MPATAWRAAPLAWGHGPVRFEMFIEPTCPYSVKALRKLEPLLDAVGAETATIRLCLQSQPWHLFSGVVSRCVLAASTLPAGRDAAWRVLNAVADRREDFVLENHATGPGRVRSIDDVIRHIESQSGLALMEAFAIPDLDREIKRHAKYARQNGIHVSPTFMLDGLVQPGLGSGDDVAVWAAAIRAAR